jgi:hypothetical protein
VNKFKLFCTAGLCALASIATGADFDGSKPLLCSTATLSECIPGGICEQVTSEEVNAPDFLRINVKKKTITVDAAGQQDRPPTKIKSSSTIDEKLFLQGSDDGVEGVRDGLAWSVAIDQNSGKMVLTASGDAVGFVIFGACTTL